MIFDSFGFFPFNSEILIDYFSHSIISQICQIANISTLIAFEKFLDLKSQERYLIRIRERLINLRDFPKLSLLFSKSQKVENIVAFISFLSTLGALRTLKAKPFPLFSLPFKPVSENNFTLPMFAICKLQNCPEFRHKLLPSLVLFMQNYYSSQLSLEKKTVSKIA